MLVNPAGYLTGFCGDRNPDAHSHCRGAVSRGSGASELGELLCVCLCHTDQRDEYLDQLFDGICFRTRDPDTGEVLRWRTHAEALAYAAENDAYKENERRNALPPLDDEERALLAAADAASTPVQEGASA